MDYILIGFGVWLGLAAHRQKMLSTATWRSIAVGFISSLLVWPILVLILYVDAKDGTRCE
jgi:ABC-type Fe3+ transport system permease subunit